MSLQTTLYSANFEISFVKMIDLEGGYVNHPDDPGGVTNLGVTRKTWAVYTNRQPHEVGKPEMRALTVRDVKALYHSAYWNAVRADDLPGGVDLQAFDIAVNSGPGRSIRMLQKALNKISGARLRVDGRIGPKTLAATHGVNVFHLIDEVAVTRLWFYFDLSTFRSFGRGWGKRAVKVATFATSLAHGRAEARLLTQ